MDGELRGKVAIITGGAMGIGKAVAQRLHQELAHVVLVDIDRDVLEQTAKEIAPDGERMTTFCSDVRDVQEIRRVVAQTVESLKQIDILVNVAAVMRSIPFVDISVEEWDRVIEVNMRGTFFFMQEVAKHMISRIPEEERVKDRSEKSWGKIVNFSSISGRRGREVQAHYAATKAAAISLTQSAALAFARYNINVNAVAPSVVITPMWEKSNIDKSRIFSIPVDQANDEFINRIPLKRPGTGLDMAEAVLFLCTSRSDYITGQTLGVDGGFEMH